jgi:hypothetical protein
MPTYVFTYRTPKDYRGSAESMTLWSSWFEQLGDHVQDRGNPVFARSQLGADPRNTVLGGYSLITADNLDDALDVAKTCPILASDGCVEVGELTPLESGRQLTT